MKRLWCSIGLLAVITGFCAFSAFRVDRICRDASDILRQAETQCYLGNFQSAEDTVYLASALWKKHEAFLGIALRHTETDDIDVMFPGLIESVRQKNPEEFLLKNAEIIAAFRSLSRMELPYHFNIL